MTDQELMQQTLDALEDACGGRCNAENNPCWQSSVANALRDRLAQPEPVTGNLLKDAYNAMVEKKTRSQKLREAGFTRRPKGWEKEKGEQEPVAFYVYKPTLPRGHLGNVSDGDLPWVYDQDPSSGYSARMLVYTTPPQRKPLNETTVFFLADKYLYEGGKNYGILEFARAIEFRHGIDS